MIDRDKFTWDDPDDIVVISNGGKQRGQDSSDKNIPQRPDRQDRVEPGPQDRRRAPRKDHHAERREEDD